MPIKKIKLSEATGMVLNNILGTLITETEQLLEKNVKIEHQNKMFYPLCQLNYIRSLAKEHVFNDNRTDSLFFLNKIKKTNKHFKRDCKKEYEPGDLKFMEQNPTNLPEHD